MTRVSTARWMLLVLLGLVLLEARPLGAAPRALEAQRRAQRRALSARMGEPAPPTGTRPRDAAASPTDDDVTPPPTPARAGEGEDAVLRLRLQLGALHRSLRFTQDLYQRMRRQQLSAPVYRLDGAVFPLLGLMPLGARVGLVAGYERAFAGRASDSDFGASYDVQYSEWYGGVRLAHPLRGDLLGFELSAGRLDAGLRGDPDAGTPDVRYTFVRSGLDFTLRRGPIEAAAAAGFRVPLAYGQLGEVDWFPRVGGYGVEAGLSVRYALSPRLSGEVSASARRFLLEMNPAPEDAAAGVSEVVGGATDDYLTAYVGLRLAL